jgi:hypothetical protein
MQASENKHRTRRIITYIAFALLSCAFPIIGLIMGSMYGGNYATGIKFMDLQGYEATGLMGLFIGYAMGGCLLAYLIIRLTRHSTGR